MEIATLAALAPTVAGELDALRLSARPTIATCIPRLPESCTCTHFTTTCLMTGTRKRLALNQSSSLRSQSAK